jgi:hypothetical protein
MVFLRHYTITNLKTLANFEKEVEEGSFYHNTNYTSKQQLTEMLSS